MIAAGLCVLILVVTVIQKFTEGGWLTLVITAGLIGFCFAVAPSLPRRRPRARACWTTRSRRRRRRPGCSTRAGPTTTRRELDAARPIAVLLVGGYGGLGRHALLTLLRMFPGHFQGVVFVSVAVVDSDVFKGAKRDPGARGAHARSLAEYERFATALGLPATSAYAVGTEVAVEAEQLAVGLVQWYPKVVVVAGQIIFAEDTVWNRILHNQTALVIQRRLQQRGVPMIVHARRAGPGTRPGRTRAGDVSRRPPARRRDRPQPDRREADRPADAFLMLADVAF